LAKVSEERILIVEDDERIGSTLLRALSGNGYEARWALTGQGAIEETTRHRPDLVILDLGLPDMDGLEVCRQIRLLDLNVGIIMLTARDEELDIVVGLDAGAIDYITKPFKLAELLARIRAQFRRGDSSALPRTTFDDLTVDLRARRVWIAGNEVSLRSKEFDLLARLLADVGHVVTRDTLMTDVWDEHWFGSTKTLDFHISALRHKIDRPDHESRITTLRGVGYRYELP
jgi:DNA-binding response OmpR family regulator